MMFSFTYDFLAMALHYVSNTYVIKGSMPILFSWEPFKPSCFIMQFVKLMNAVVIMAEHSR